MSTAIVKQGVNWKRTGSRALRTVLVLVFLLVMITPVYIVVSNSFRETLAIKQMPPQLIFKPTFVHFQRLIQKDNFLRYFLNSTIIAGSVTVATIGLDQPTVDFEGNAVGLRAEAVRIQAR